ncbi:MAG: acetyl-CoA carboxylase biotin carboxylase subunit, partial [Acidobacteriota bacterium]|nr:acetyl-CoA carboxylase biotin carboxylase subunit [Acidobacteriota bacterium]
SGIYQGWSVPIEYDPMLAKLIVWAGTREYAIERMLRALGEYHVGGIRSNIPLFRASLNDTAFRAGELHTGYLDALLKSGIDFDVKPEEGLAAIAALIAAGRKPAAPAAPASNGKSGWLTAGREGLLQ